MTSPYRINRRGFLKANAVFLGAVSTSALASATAITTAFAQKSAAGFEITRTRAEWKKILTRLSLAMGQSG